MATATITRLSPTMPSQGSYDYLYQANVGLKNLNSVWAHGPRRPGKENRPTTNRAKAAASSSRTPLLRPRLLASALLSARIEILKKCLYVFVQFTTTLVRTLRSYLRSGWNTGSHVPSDKGQSTYEIGQAKATISVRKVR